MARACFYNVEHGDYIAIKTDNDISIIRDCGSLGVTTRGILPRFLPHMTSCYERTSLHEAIVTHPHEDHYWGFEQLHKHQNIAGQKFFDVAYVPILYLNYAPLDFVLLNLGNYNIEDLSLTALAVKVALHLYKHLPAGTSSPNPSNWLKVAPLLAGISSRLIGVHAGSSFFNHWQPKGTVLWPPHLGSKYYSNNHEKLRALLSDGLFANDNIDHYVVEVLKLIKDIINNAQQLPNVDFLSRINNILSSIKPEAQQDAQHNDTIEKKARQFGTFIDDHSIVFSIGNEGSSALFLSDLNEAAMNMMVDDMKALNNNDQYTFIKSAHHGTRLSKKLYNRFIKQTNSIRIVVHSCGAGQGNSKEPDAPNQQYKYTNLKPTIGIDCTSWKTCSWKQPCPFNKFSCSYKCYII